MNHQGGSAKDWKIGFSIKNCHTFGGYAAYFWTNPKKWWWISAGKNGLLVYSYRYRDLYSIYSGSRVRVGEELGNGSDADVPTGWGFGVDRFFRSTSLKMSKVCVTCRIIPGIVGGNKHNFWTLSAKNNIGHHGKKHIETHNWDWFKMVNNCAWAL